MSKGLKALEILKKRQWVDIEHYTALCEFIEKELKDYEILKEYHNAVVSNKEFDKEYFHKCIKALEIIKKKKVSICWLENCKDRAEYNDLASEEEQLIQEEFDLLKEVLL